MEDVKELSQAIALSFNQQVKINFSSNWYI
jgi:hypothetical protein